MESSPSSLLQFCLQSAIKLNPVFLRVLVLLALLWQQLPEAQAGIFPTRKSAAVPSALTHSALTQLSMPAQASGTEGRISEESHPQALDPVSPAPPEKVVDITSDKLVYDDTLKAYVATGHVSVVVSEENTELRALKMTYIPDKQLLIAEQNVEMIKDGQPTYGTFARIDLSRQCALINQPNAKLGVVRMTGAIGLVSKDYIELG